MHLLIWDHLLWHLSPCRKLAFQTTLRLRPPVLHCLYVCQLHCADMLPESWGERILFHGSWNLPRIFCKISCSQFCWKLKDENRRIFRQIFTTFFAHVGETFRARASLWGLLGINDNLSNLHTNAALSALFKQLFLTFHSMGFPGEICKTKSLKRYEF